jgi:hypothetical protein
MAAIYEKALKRRDFSGVVDQTISGPKAGVANTAKIVNLMSGDANKIALQVSGEFRARSRFSTLSSFTARSTRVLRRSSRGHYRFRSPVPAAWPLCLCWIRRSASRNALDGLFLETQCSLGQRMVEGQGCADGGSD